MKLFVDGVKFHISDKDDFSVSVTTRNNEETHESKEQNEKIKAHEDVEGRGLKTMLYNISILQKIINDSGLPGVIRSTPDISFDYESETDNN